MAGLNRLRAVNIALENIGESPVNTLVGSAGDVSVATAEAVLDEINRDVCEQTWNFNKDTAYALTPDGAGNIVMTSSMLSVDPTDRTLMYSVRQGKLYDMDNQTFVFTAPVDCEILWEFPYEDTPQHVRKYIAMRAARTFARRVLGDEAGDRITEQDEGRARVSAKRNDARNRDRTIFQDYASGGSLHRLKNRRIF